MKQFAKKDVRVMGIFLNDVQRKEASDISYTFVSGLFMVYTKFLVELEGVHFVDPSQKHLTPPIMVVSAIILFHPNMVFWADSDSVPHRCT